jgi:Fanconi anemia group J protein
VLLTSGTLSPLDSFSGELGLDFTVRLEAPHVVDINKQVRCRTLSSAAARSAAAANFIGTVDSSAGCTMTTSDLNAFHD